ncbi:MAG: DUF481 domain-containing protein [Bacteroidota bacterium]
MRCLALVLVLSLASPAAAQINTEQLRKSTDDGIHLQLDAGGGFSSGNTDILQLSAGARVDASAGENSGFGLARYTLSEVDGATDVSNAFAHLRYNSEIAPDVIGEVFAQVERNEQTLLARRYLVGGGVRFEIIETEAVGFAFGTTPMIERERLRPEAMEDPVTAFRWSNYLALRVDVSETAEAFAVVYGQPRVEAASDYRILHEARLDLDVTRFVKVRVRNMVRYDSQPPLGVESTDVMLTTGLVFNSLGN